MSEVTNQEVVFSEPPPSGWGANGSGKWEWLFDALRVNPGRWAELPRGNGSVDKFNLSERRKGQGFTSTTRKMPDGTKKVWIRYDPPASAS